MTEYKYETHLHTAESSKCASSPGADYAQHFKNLGYTGIFVTDHFLNGNTTVPPDLPWAERIDRFCHGYDVTAEAARKVGLDVFFGWEYSYGSAHFLTYGLGKDWLLANPELLEWDLVSYFQRVREAGGLISHAHPFRERVEIVLLVPGQVDAVEVLNGARSHEHNRHALDYATSFRLPHTGGSDIHSISTKRLCGMSFPRRLRDDADFIRAVKSGEGLLFNEVCP